MHVERGRCVSTSRGANVEQASGGGAGEAWRARGMGLGYYELLANEAVVCADVAKGSRDSGANVQVWSCNDLAPQLWRFDRL